MDLGSIVKRRDHGVWHGLMAQNIANSTDAITLGHGVHGTNPVPMIVGRVAALADAGSSVGAAAAHAHARGGHGSADHTGTTAHADKREGHRVVPLQRSRLVR